MFLAPVYWKHRFFPKEKAAKSGPMFVDSVCKISQIHVFKYNMLFHAFYFAGASFFVIVLHAAFYHPGDEGEPFDLEMEPV